MTFLAIIYAFIQANVYGDKVDALGLTSNSAL